MCVIFFRYVCCAPFWCSRYIFRICLPLCTKLSHYLSKKLDNQFVKDVIILYLVTFTVILPIFCHKLPHSIYHVRHKEFAEKELIRENDERLQQADRYLGMLSQSKLHEMFDKTENGSVDVAITLITVSRNRHRVDKYEPRYLTQVTWKLLMLLHQSKTAGIQHNIKLSICNVDSDPSSYHEAKKLSAHVPVFNRFKKVTLYIGSVLEKEKQDYVFCMNSSLAFNPKYVLLVEDDALPTDDFFTVLDHVLRTMFVGHVTESTHSRKLKDVTYIKFYHPERLLSYISLEPDRIPELLSIGALFGTLTCLFYIHVYAQGRLVGIYKVWFVFMIYCILVALAVGRANIIEFRRLFTPHLYTVVPAPECCTPAMLFPAQGAVQVVDFLSGVKCKKNYGKDIALEGFRRENRLPAYMIQPNLVTHIGMYSSLRTAKVDPFVV